jgi:hypothetical protein
MRNRIYLTFAIFGKLQIEEKQTIRKNDDIKTWKKKRWKTKQKIKEFLLQEYVVKREYNAEKKS